MRSIRKPASRISAFLPSVLFPLFAKPTVTMSFKLTVFTLCVLVAVTYAKPDFQAIVGPQKLYGICDLGLCVNNQCPGIYWCCPYSNICCRNTMTVEATESCKDKVNPFSGVSECEQKKDLCSNEQYVDLMKEQCPRTCGFCKAN